MNEYIAKNWKAPKGLTIRAWLNNRSTIHKETMLCPSTGGLTKLGDVKISGYKIAFVQITIMKGHACAVSSR